MIGRRQTFESLIMLLTLASACTSGATLPGAGTPDHDERASESTTLATAPPTTTVTPTATDPPSPTLTPTTTTVPAIDVSLRLVRHTTDTATSDFVMLAQGTLTDPQGWQQAGFRFRFAEDARYTVLLAEPAEIDAVCAPYEVQSTYSCQIGDLVALNAERWRHATPTWTASLEEYRRMLLNHEVGHLLGQHHVTEPCPAPGVPAPVMAQQSKGLAGCTPNPWPLVWEIDCAARHIEPLAPGYEPEATPTCGPEGVR